MVVGQHGNKGKVAICYGPLVLAADEALLGGEHTSLNAIAVASADRTALAITPELAPEKIPDLARAQVFHLKAVAGAGRSPLDIQLVPFAAAGTTGKNYKVWLPLVGR